MSSSRAGSPLADRADTATVVVFEGPLRRRGVCPGFALELRRIEARLG